MIAHYKLFLAFHVIAIITWMAGILYLYRLFVYHAMETESVVKSRFVVMERKLYRFITLPSMWVAFALGVSMIALQPSLLSQAWLHAKLTLVVLLMVSTLAAGRIRVSLAQETCTISSKAFRFLNEFPTLLMIGIVLLVILRPF